MCAIVIKLQRSDEPNTCTVRNIECLRIVRVIIPIWVVSILTGCVSVYECSCSVCVQTECMRWNKRSQRVQRLVTQRASTRWMFNFVPFQLHMDEKCRERIYVVCITHPLFWNSEFMISNGPLSSLSTQSHTNIHATHAQCLVALDGCSFFVSGSE